MWCRPDRTSERLRISNKCPACRFRNGLLTQVNERSARSLKTRQAIVAAFSALGIPQSTEAWRKASLIWLFSNEGVVR